MRITAARFTGVSLLVMLALPVCAYAGVLQCQRAITDGMAKLTRVRLKALQTCEEKTVKDKQPPGTDCLVDTVVLAKLAVAQAELTADVADKCGGKNRTCNAADTGKDADVPLTDVGWNVATCPDLEGTGCTNAIADCNDIVTCLACVGVAAANQASDVYYGSLALPTQGIDRVLNKCQLTVGKEAVKFLRKRSIALQKCEGRVRRGTSAAPCPDAKATEQIAGAEQAKVKRICALCGGGDKTCGGGDDFTSADIGFLPTCPSVTIPGGASCAGAITTLDELIACVDCVTEFKTDCVDALSALAFTTYPTECVAPPGP